MVLDEVGTENEKARAAILFEQEKSTMTQEERIFNFQELTVHSVPSTWQLPVEISKLKV